MRVLRRPRRSSEQTVVRSLRHAAERTPSDSRKPSIMLFAPRRLRPCAQSRRLRRTFARTHPSTEAPRPHTARRSNRGAARFTRAPRRFADGCGLRDVGSRRPRDAPCRLRPRGAHGTRGGALCRNPRGSRPASCRRRSTPGRRLTGAAPYERRRAVRRDTRENSRSAGRRCVHDRLYSRSLRDGSQSRGGRVR